MCLYANWGLVFKGLHVMPAAQNTGLKWWALKRAIQCSPAICCLPLDTHYRTFWCFGFWGVLFGQQPLNQMPFASGEPVRGTLPQTILLMGWVGHASPIHCYKLVIFVIEAIHLPFILCSCPYCYGPEPFLAADGIKRKGRASSAGCPGSLSGLVLSFKLSSTIPHRWSVSCMSLGLWVWLGRGL